MRQAILPALVIFLLAGCGAGPAPDAAPDDPSITHGPLLGRLGSDRVAVWARTARPGSFRVFYGTSPDALSSSAGPVKTSLDHDNTGWTLIDGLRSNTKYYYEVSSREAPAGVERLRGHFHTLPTADDARDPETNPDGLFNVRFEFACGNNQGEHGSVFKWDLPAFATLRRSLVRDDEPSKIDFAILNGDWLYEEMRTFSPEQWREQVGASEAEVPKVVRVMPNITGVWENYKLYLSRGKTLAAFHRFAPYFFTFDDHEIVNDAYGAGEVGYRHRRPVFRDIGVRAWYDYLGWANEVPPTQEIVFGRCRLEAGGDTLVDAEADFSRLKLEESATLHVHWGAAETGEMNIPSDTEGGDPNAGVYEIVEVIDEHSLRIRPPASADGEASYSIGRRSYFHKRISNSEWIFLDTRTYREMHDVSNRNQKASMLGARQKAWVKEVMRTSDADFFFVVSTVNLTIPHIGGTGGAVLELANKDDAWTVFLNEREELIEFWDGLGKPVFVLTGDLHNSFAIKVTDRVWEFASGPHNSINHPASSEGNRPPNGPYDSFGRKVEIRWSSYITADTPNEMRGRPVYCVVQVSNVFFNPKQKDKPRWVAYPVPQATFQYYDAVTGDLLYAESILASR